MRAKEVSCVLHLLLDHDCYLPVYAHVTEGMVN